MCGINGFNWENEKLLLEMCKVTKSRGPDYIGTYITKELSLGHLLLAIRESFDISKQPYQDNPEWILLFNGQIYNTSQLTKKLDSLDPIKKELDTYILYKVIEKYGWNFTDHIHGMYAIALLNTKSRELRLYRDPAGQKQLYYYLKDGRLIFGSEIKGILMHQVDKSVDEIGLSLSGLVGYIPGDRTIFKYIHKLNPSEYISWNLADNELRSSYFKSGTENYFPNDPTSAFSQLVAEHLQSKQRVALNLSGGLDSSILLHEMSKAGHEMHTYTTVFEDISEHSSYNRDAELALKLARDYGSTHTEIKIDKSAYLNNFISAYASIEEPNFNISLPIYFETAKIEGINGDRNRVILSGDGGDEIFGGYPHYAESLRMKKFYNLLTPFIFNFIKNRRNDTHYDFTDPSERWLFFRKLNFNALVNPETDTSIKYLKDATDNLTHLYQAKKGVVYETMLRDRYLWMSGENFIRSDKIFMSQSVEMRSPFAFEPFRHYIDNLLNEDDYVSPRSNKIFLRKLYDGRLPDYITKRTDKTGWRSPIKEWYDKDIKNFFLEIISSVKSGSNYIDWQKIENRIQTTDQWPGKEIHLYLSLAIISDKYKIEL